MPIQQTTNEAWAKQRVGDSLRIVLLHIGSQAHSYIKELADRLNSLENQIQHPSAPGQSFDYAGLSDQSMAELQALSQFTRKRTHSASEGLQDTSGRPNWSGQDRGTSARESSMWASLTHQDFPTNGLNVRRSSFSEINLAGSLITGLNEEVLKAYDAVLHLVSRPDLTCCPDTTAPFIRHYPSCHTMFLHSTD